MAKIILHKPTVVDVLALINGLRELDLQEMEAVGVSPEQAVLESLRCVDVEFCFAAHVDGVLLGVGGCSKTGAPWMLCTDAVDGHWFALSRIAKRYLPKMLAKYGRLSNWADVRQLGVMAWLESLGFVFAEVLTCHTGFELRRFVY